MQIRKKVAITYVALSGLSTLLLCAVMVILFKNNNQYYFLKRLQDRAKIVSSIHYQNDPAKAEYYRNLKSKGLEELIDEGDWVLPVNGSNSFEYNTELQLPPEFYTEVLSSGSSWVEDDSRYHYAQLFEENGKKYIVVITARDRRGNTSTWYIIRMMAVGGLLFLVLAYFLGRFLANTVINPISKINSEVKRISASNLHNRLDQPIGADEIAELSRTFNDMLNRLETSFEIQANFINNASHELKTPITTIMAETEIILQSKRTSDEYEEALTNINAQATKLGNLTEGLLKLTRTGYDGNKQVQDVARFDELLEDVKADLDKIIPENNISLRMTELPDNEEFLLLPCNRPLLELALSNIISNAVKYSDNSVVFVELLADKSQITVRITDIGIGIPKEDLPFLYEPFFRGKKASRYNGYGLGLPLAFKIIRMHDGDLDIQSETDKGTMATITFKRPH
ncbi:HAMP domain-containing sensor histidine kinase [Flavobacterium sp.]|uniref:sensor histidine kinase n=1 Tax=Flavobacterium sp. TaxID=239 RepID=UPI0012220D14|nr:HAMP domain-containing sensor histidine kinase [Flavobacterium sp.]RZJ71387.1 MAG: HAMP domain-containing histidine kinase [Flavobacterium sp.]